MPESLDTITVADFNQEERPTVFSTVHRDHDPLHTKQVAVMIATLGQTITAARYYSNGREARGSTDVTNRRDVSSGPWQLDVCSRCQPSHHHETDRRSLKPWGGRIVSILVHLQANCPTDREYVALASSRALPGFVLPITNKCEIPLSFRFTLRNTRRWTTVCMCSQNGREGVHRRKHPPRPSAWLHLNLNLSSANIPPLRA